MEGVREAGDREKRYIRVREKLSMYARSLPHLWSHFSWNHVSGFQILHCHQGCFHLRNNSLRVWHFLSLFSAIYIGETGRTLRQRFVEHLRSMSGFPIVEHFYTYGHTIEDAQVRGIIICIAWREQVFQRNSNLPSTDEWQTLRRNDIM